MTKPAKRPIGRPSIYTQELADKICAQVAEAKSMRTICLADDMPDMTTVFSWLRTKPDFLKQYERAKEQCADVMAEDALDIIDDGKNDWMEIHDKDGRCVGYRVNGEAIQRSRLRFEGRKWLMGKLRPRKYGDKVDVDHGVQDGDPLATLLMSLQGSTIKPRRDEGET